MVVALLSLLVTVLMYKTRIAGMKKYKIKPQRCQDKNVLEQELPKEIMRVAHNYNHLFEQPTLFYAVVIVIALMGHVDLVHVICAWAYAALRVIHSAIQITIDFIMARFLVFVLSWFALGIMIVRETWLLFS